MDNTQYIALSRQMVMRRQLDFIAHNIANADTTGFKAEKPLFVQYVEKAGRKDQITLVSDFGSVRDLREGAFQTTGNPLDLAIHGDGYFAIGQGNDVRYTRNGHFELDEESRLVTSAGDPVLDIDGREIQLGAGDTDITVGPDGTISSRAGLIARLQIVAFERPQDLNREANSLYSTNQDPIDPRNSSVVQGAIEESNVVPVVEMTNMITLLRSYQSVQKLIDTDHNQQRDAVDKIMKA
ncbi:MAG: flagellar basal-body rod protein FlgF [Rhodospirillaceae bacterium]|jgi:flagellar basal-body rod protein FlgF|nr:flagellar basal-body rod protein FlgF [Rhodospirillaceae bacterium]|tara:strand:+ start:496 stop:1212 length:717 start_codon:yes stop_codon:yes gene_type:complete